MGLRLTPMLLILAVAPVAPAEPSGNATDRGAYLVNGIAGCGNCHAPQDAAGPAPGAPLSGGPALLSPAFTAYPPNITPDKATGIGGWTERQIVTALREGRTPDGRTLRPPMPIPFYRRMSDADAHAIAAYLRSLPPVASRSAPSEYKVPTPRDYGPPLGTVDAPLRSDAAAYGAYLGALGHCMLCHTPAGANGQRDYANRLGAGGLHMDGPFGSRVSANITQDRDAGIGAWSDGEIKAAIRDGVRPDGRRLAAPMPTYYFRNLEDADLDALVAWLRTLPPVRHAAE